MAFIFEDASFRSGAKLVLEHTNWEVKRGEHWAVIGPTGSGKTLLARAVCRELPLAQGQVRFFFSPREDPDGRPFPRPGDVLVYSAETHRDFMRRYSDYAQARFESLEREGPPTTARVLAPERGRRAKRGLRALLLAEFGLSELLHRPVHLLSHGESHKVFLARLLLRSPRLLILDDPYLGLDEQTRAVLARFIDQLLRAGAPQVIFLTSRPDEIPSGVECILRLQDCQVAGIAAKGEVDPPEEPHSLLSHSPNQPDFSAAVQRYESRLAEGGQTQTRELIRMRAVTITYGKTRVLDAVDWTVRAGERWALLGPNGAGKTTLLSLVLGDHPQAYASDISLFGQRRGSGESIWEIKARQGWVSPDLQIHFPRAMNCLDVACSGYFDSIGLFRRPTLDQEESARGWLLALDAAAPGGSFGNLSTGQQRLVLLARALVKHPPLLVLDEPLQGLDLAYRRRILALVDLLCAHSSLNLVFVSHYADELPRSITHRLWLEKGRVLANGPV